jgi:acyl carrier protein
MPHMTLTIRAVRAGGKTRMPYQSLVESAEDRCYSQTVASQVPGDFSLSVMPSPDAIEQEVRQFLRDNFPLSADGVTLHREDSLIEVGVIDSTGVLELIGFIEERYELAIADEEVLPENLDSIANITRFVGDKTASANGTG